MFNVFLASQEKSRKEFMALETRRLEMEEKQRKRDAERDNIVPLFHEGHYKMFLSFMKDTFAMMMPPPPIYPIPPGAYPPVIPTVPRPTEREREETGEDSD